MRKCPTCDGYYPPGCVSGEHRRPDGSLCNVPVEIVHDAIYHVILTGGMLVVLADSIKLTLPPCVIRDQILAEIEHARKRGGK